jgi:signal transduction histidine kinase
MRQIGQLPFVSLIALAPIFAPSLSATGSVVSSAGVGGGSAVARKVDVTPAWPGADSLPLILLLVISASVIALLAARLLAIRRKCVRLADANAALQSSLSSRTDFLATTSHEIRNPLNGILGMTEVMLADRQLDAAVRDRISVVHGAGETMKALVDDILDIARIDAGGLTIDSISMDFRQLIEDARRLWQTQAAAKCLSLEIDLAGCPMMIVGDPLRLRQILSNLMSNAIKFTYQGKVTLSARAEPGPDGERLVVRVRDTGIGVPSRQQDLIFEKYRQADGSITRRFGGTGLGLAICRSLAKAMGGAILIDSVPGEGSTFTVNLPLLRVGASEGTVDLPSYVPARRLADASVLVVEQNALTRRVIVKMIEDAVLTVETAPSLGLAEERLAQGGIDHVLADIGCTTPEDGDGHSGLLRLCDVCRTSGTRVTLLFAPGRAAAAASVANGTGIQALAKPIASADLIAARGNRDGRPAATRPEIAMSAPAYAAGFAFAAGAAE